MGQRHDYHLTWTFISSKTKQRWQPFPGSSKKVEKTGYLFLRDNTSSIYKEELSYIIGGIHQSSISSGSWRSIHHHWSWQFFYVCYQLIIKKQSRVVSSWRITMQKRSTTKTLHQSMAYSISQKPFKTKVYSFLMTIYHKMSGKWENLFKPSHLKTVSFEVFWRKYWFLHFIVWFKESLFPKAFVDSTTRFPRIPILFSMTVTGIWRDYGMWNQVPVIVL